MSGRRGLEDEGESKVWGRERSSMGDPIGEGDGLLKDMGKIGTDSNLADYMY